MGKKQVLRSLPEGDYEVESSNNGILKTLPADGDYEISTPSGDYDFSSDPHFNAIKEQKEPKDIEPIVEELARTSRGGLTDGEKDVLRQLLTNPATTPEQAKKGIAAIQGYGDKQSEDNTMYYVKQEDNGVLVPQQLAYGERPPEGYDVAKVFSSAKEAKDDSWYTDVAKSVYNGALVAAEGLLSLAQQGNMAITDEESKLLNNLRNTADALKVTKDEDLDKRFIKSGSIKKASDLLNTENYDISPETIWGTANMLAESVVATIGGGGLVKAAPKVKALVGSYISQLSDNLDGANEVGLSGREAAGMSAVQTGAMAALDAVGLDQYLFGNSAKAAKKELFKRLAVELPKNADGTLTKEGLEMLATKLPQEYLKLARVGLKEYGKGVAVETVTETGQEFVRRASEALWDKLTPESKAKFGTEIDSPEAFAAYVENGLAGLVGGLGMSGLSTNYKQKYQEQSGNIYAVIKKGDAAINELKANLDIAKNKGQITPKEYDQAIFKVDAYRNYNEQIKDETDLTDEEKKNAFELSFNIEAIKSEIPTDREDIEKLDPIAIAKIDSKKKLVKGLQEELNKIILKEDVKKETKVGQETVDKVAKNEEPKEGETKLDDLLKTFGVIKPVEAEEVDIQAEMPKQREDITKVAPKDWNDDSKYTSLQRKQITQEALKTAPNNEFEAKLQEAPNKKMAVILPDGKKLYLAQSAPSTDPNAANYMKRENFPKTREDVTDESGQPLEAYKEPVRVKRVEIDAYDLETDEPQFKEDGSPKRKAVLSVYNPETGKQIAYVRELDAYKGKYVSSKYSPTEKSQLNAIAEANHLNEEIEPFTYKAPSEAAKQPKKVLETETVAKPDLAMEFITDKDALGKEITETIVEEEGGEELEITQKVAKSQSEIKREFELLKKLMDCIHG